MMNTKKVTEKEQVTLYKFEIKLNMDINEAIKENDIDTQKQNNINFIT